MKKTKEENFMKNKRKNLLIVSLVSALAFSSAVTITLLNNKHIKITSADECDHVGNHYAAKEATFDEAGYDEFYVCCKCHSVFLDQPEVGTFSEDGSLIGGVNEGHPAYIAPVTTWEERIMQSGGVFNTYVGGVIKNIKANRANDSMSFRVGKDPASEEQADVQAIISFSNRLLKLAKSEGATALAFDLVVDEALFGRNPNYYAAITSNSNWMINYDEAARDLTQKHSYQIDLTKYDFDGDDANASFDFYLRDSAFGGHNSLPANVTLSNLTFVNSIDKMFNSKGAVHNYFTIERRNDVNGNNKNVPTDITALDTENKAFEMADCQTFHIGLPLFELLRSIDGFGSLSFKMRPNNQEEVNAFCTIRTPISETGNPYVLQNKNKAEDGSLEVVLTKEFVDDTKNLEFLWRDYDGTVNFRSQGARFYDFRIVTTGYDTMFDSIDNLKAIFTAQPGTNLTLQADLVNRVITLDGTHSVHISNAFLTSALNAGKTKMKFHLHSDTEGLGRLTVVSDGVTSEEATAKGYQANWAIGFTAVDTNDTDITIDLNHLVEFPTLFYKLEPQKSDFSGFAAEQVMSNIRFE